MNRRTIILSLAGLLTPALACAQDPVDPINANRKGLALQGYDPVAYFEQGGPKKGSGKLVSSWNGVDWRFSSEENKALFDADPAQYAPQYGGYCAWAVSEGYTAPVDPRAWTVHDGKLYLNYNKDVQKQWLAETEARIQAGDRNWPQLHR